MPPRDNKYVRDLLTFPAAAAAAWRRGGSAGVWLEARARTIDRVWEQGRLWVAEQDLEEAVEVPPPPGVVVAPLDASELDDLASIASAATLTRLRRALQRGRTCLAARRDGRVVGYGWLSREAALDVEGYPLPLPEGVAYAWDLHVTPAERNRGVGSALASARLARAREAGFRRVWRVVDPRSGASLRTLERTAGAVRVVGEIEAMKLGRWRRASFRPVAARPLRPGEAP